MDNSAPAGPPFDTRRVQRRSSGRGRGGKTFASLGVGLILLAGPALAVQPDEVMMDPALERAPARFRVNCAASSARTSRSTISRRRWPATSAFHSPAHREGESNDAVRDYLVSRYGDFILLKPPFRAETRLLWLSPVSFSALASPPFYLPGAARPARRRANRRGGGIPRNPHGERRWGKLIEALRLS